MFHGNGGYDWHTVYNMPIWLRRFTISSINEYNQKMEEQVNNSLPNKPNSSQPKGPNIKKPNHTLKKAK